MPLHVAGLRLTDFQDAVLEQKTDVGFFAVMGA